MSRTMKKLSVIAFILLVLMLAVFGGAEAEAGKKLQIKIPLPKTRIQTRTEGTGTLKANGIQNETAKTCEPFTLTLSNSVINMGAAKYRYMVAIDDGTYSGNLVDTLYVSDPTAETSFQYTFYQTGEYYIYAYLLSESDAYLLDESEEPIAECYKVDVSEGTGENLLMNRVNEAKAQCRKGNEFETALAINDWLCDNVTYDYSFTYYSPDGALLEGTSVCNGYCRAYELIATACGLKVDRALGSAEGDDGPVEHAWNVVRMNGKWYQVDVTFNDNGNEPHHIYFGLTDQLMGLNHTLENYPNGASYTCNSLEDNYFVVTGQWRTVLGRDSYESLKSQINQLNNGNRTVEAPLGTLYADEEGQVWNDDGFAGIYGGILAYAYSVNPWERVSGNTSVSVSAAFTYDNKTKMLTGTIGGLTLTMPTQQTFDTGDEITYSASYDAEDPSGISLSSKVYEKEDKKEYYSKQFDTYQGQDSFSLWYEDTYVLEVSAIKEGTVLETVTAEFTVEAPNGYLAYPIIPRYLTLPEGNQVCQMTLNYETGVKPDTVSITVTKGWPEETVVQTEVSADTPIEIPAQMGDSLRIEAIGYKKGYIAARARETSRVVRGTLDAPTATVPETLLAGEPFTVTANKTPNAQQYVISVYKKENDRFSRFLTRRYEDVGPYDLSLLGLDNGIYQIGISAYANEYAESSETKYEITVTGERPNAPEVIAPEGTLVQGETAWFTVNAEGLQAAARSEDAYYPYRDGEIYQAQNGTALVGEWATTYSSYAFRGLINGQWSERSEIIRLTNVESAHYDDPPEDTPKFTMSETITQGESLRLTVEPVEGAMVYAVSVAHLDEELTEEEGWPCYEQILYDMPFDISDGGVTIDSCYLMETGSYNITVTAYRDTAGSWLCDNEKTLKVTANTNLPAAPTATLIGEGDQLIYGTTAFKVQTGGGADKVYAYIHRKGDWGLDVNPIIINMDPTDTECTYEWVNRNNGTFEAYFCVSRDGIWSEPSETVEFTVVYGENWDAESTLHYPAEAEIGDEVTISWDQVEKAEWFEADVTAYGTLLFDGRIEKGSNSFTIDTSKAVTSGNVSIYVRCFAPGCYPIYLYSDDMTLLDPKLQISAEVIGTDPDKNTVTLSLTNVAANRVRVRVDGQDKGMFGIGKNDGTATITVPVSSMDSTIRVANYDTDQTKWGSWSEPVQGSGKVKPKSWALVLPASTKTVGEEAFAGITAETVKIPEGCTSVGAGAFAGSSLKVIEIPASVNEIGDNAFPTGTMIFTPSGSYAATWAENNGFEVVIE